MRRRWLLGLALAGVALTSDVGRVTFVQPVRQFVLPPYGGTEIPVQTKIPVSADNRAWALQWSGEACPGGASVRELHGADDPALEPAEAPLSVRIFAGGSCVFVASVYGAGGKLLARGDVTIRTDAGER